MNVSRQGTGAQDAQYIQGCCFHLICYRKQSQNSGKNMKKKSSFWDEDKSGSSSVVCLAACSSDGCQRG